jgi:hypothetical protein
MATMLKERADPHRGTGRTTKMIQEAVSWALQSKTTVGVIGLHDNHAQQLQNHAEIVAGDKVRQSRRGSFLLTNGSEMWFAGPAGLRSKKASQTRREFVDHAVYHNHAAFKMLMEARP